MRFSAYRAAITAPLFLFSVSLLVVGCSRLPNGFTNAPQNAAPSPRTATATHPVISTPEYRQARTLCTKQKFQEASDLLLNLSKKTDLSASDRDYCLQQRQICLKHLGKADIPVQTSVITQTASQTSDCGPRALLFLSKRAGKRTNLEALKSAGATNGKGTTLAGMAKAAQSAGWKTEGVQASREALPDLALPAIAWVDGNHYVSLLEMHGRGADGTALIQDPSQTNPETISQEKLLQRCGGYLLLMR